MSKFLIKYFSILILINFVLSCSNSGNDESILLDSSNDSFALTSSSNILLRINNDVFNTINTGRKNKVSTGDFYIINEAKREQDFIKINLSYSGGCKQHNFEIVWDGIVYTDAPCQMNLLLIHKGNNDSCEALITETININLNELMGNVIFKDNCAYHIFSTFNSEGNADIVIEGTN